VDPSTVDRHTVTFEPATVTPSPLSRRPSPLNRRSSTTRIRKQWGDSSKRFRFRQRNWPPGNRHCR